MIGDRVNEELSELEDIQFLMHCGIEAVRCMWVDMTQGDSMPGDPDYDALYGLYRSLSELDERFRESTQKLYKVCANDR